jgi:ERCC4-type nuclease
MTILVDTREHPRAIVKILAEFDRQGVKVVRRALNFADYFNPDNPGVIIDRKQNLNEIAFNVVQGRARFLREVDRCTRAGCHMIVLIEHSPRIRKLDDVIGWKNPRLKVSPLAVSGERLFKIMKAMESRFGIEWQFCGKAQTGKRIIELLGGNADEVCTDK